MKVFVGLSGGVDSSVAAKLLIDEGHDVAGAFIRIWQPEFLECTWAEDRLAAKRTAASLGIPFFEVDLSEDYKSAVITDMIEGYRRGITPNPDVLCNRRIKFGAFRAWARAQGAEKIATGHYARIVERSASQTNRLELHRGMDTMKDQSYFLYQLTQEDLRDVLFPIGGYPKREVRSMAKKWELPSARRPDSQGLCFIGDVEIGEFLARYIPLQAGDVLDADGAVIGRHDGAARYTIGQRHGFEIAGGSETAARYVVAIDAAKNTITVSDKPELAHALRVELIDCSWVNEPPRPDSTYEVSLRYQQPPQKARLVSLKDGKTCRATFDSPQLIAPGQSAVAYEGDRVLGGGIVHKQR